MKRLLYVLPLGVFLILAVYFAVGLGKDPRKMEQMLINQPIPPLDLAAIQGRDKGIKTEDFMGQVTLVNIFGSWCVSCQVEHPFLMKLKEANAVPIYGIDWREKSAEAGPAWLRRYGDPYTLVGDDPESKAAIAFGVTGAPESFIVDQKGIIRYKHVGPINEQNWSETLFPIIEELRKG